MIIDYHRDFSQNSALTKIIDYLNDNRLSLRIIDYSSKFCK